MAIKKAVSDVKQRVKQKQVVDLYVSEESQNRLSAILADAPTIEKLAGTEWEMRPLRFGTQYLIVDEVRKIKEMENATYENCILGLAATIPALSRVITLALLNDKNRIYQNGDPNQGYSAQFKKTCNTVLWSAEKGELLQIFWDCIQMIDVNFFMDALAMLQSFRNQITEKKRTRTKIAIRK